MHRADFGVLSAHFVVPRIGAHSCAVSVCYVLWLCAMSVSVSVSVCCVCVLCAVSVPELGPTPGQGGRVEPAPRRVRRTPVRQLRHLLRHCLNLRFISRSFLCPPQNPQNPNTKTAAMVHYSSVSRYIACCFGLTIRSCAYNPILCLQSDLVLKSDLVLTIRSCAYNPILRNRTEAVLVPLRRADCAPATHPVSPTVITRPPPL